MISPSSVAVSSNGTFVRCQSVNILRRSKSLVLFLYLYPVRLPSLPLAHTITPRPAPSTAMRRVRLFRRAYSGQRVVQRRSVWCRGAARFPSLPPLFSPPSFTKGQRPVQRCGVFDCSAGRTAGSVWYSGAEQGVQRAACGTAAQRVASRCGVFCTSTEPSVFLFPSLPPLFFFWGDQ